MQGIGRRLLCLSRQAALALAVSSAAVSCAWALPSFTEVKRDYKPSDIQVLDRNGELLHTLRSDKTVRRGQWVALADISPALRSAIVLSEDKRFYEHSGVDWQAVSAAAWANLWNTRTRGASTITMQLAGLLDDDYKRGGSGRSLVQKLGQTLAATSLERGWRKDQILEAYLNLVPLRGELVGVDALARTLFGKAPQGLDEREAAIAAALVRAPNASPATVARRACGVLQDMGQAAQQQAGNAARVDCDALDLFATAALQRRGFDASSGIAPHVAQRLLTVRAEPVEAGRKQTQAALSSSIRTTLRAPLQRFAVQTLQTQLRELRGRHVEDAALVVLDNASGQVLAWVGSSGELSAAADVDGVLAPRQPGSTLKPFLYGQAIAERRLTAASLLEDSPNQIATAGGLYIPQNYDHQFKGWVTARTALGASLNVPAVRTLEMVSPNAFHKQLRALGLPLRETGDYYGYSLALGSAEVSLLDLANAYRALANGGRYSKLAPLALAAGTAKPPAFTQALDARAAFVVSDILSDGNARARTFGTDSVLATRFWTAVKTGTSKDMRDNWAVGYSSRYTVGVWVGNASGAAMWDVSGTSGAAPIWAATMQYLHKGVRSRAPAPPPGLEQHSVRFAKQLEASRGEWFLRGTGQDTVTLQGPAPMTPGKATDGQPVAHITSPVSGTIVALDPDIPPAHQRLRFTQEGAPAGARWLMDGKEFGRGAQAAWLPWPGKHQVRLVAAKGQVLDEVRIEVRGAGVRMAGR
jgi:penicillin-binding protein 1C